jgi:hypothetical protein
MNLFLVAVEDQFNRDVQIATNKDCNQLDLDGWEDSQGDLVIEKLWANSPEDAITLVSSNRNISSDILIAYELNQKLEEDHEIVTTIKWHTEDLAEVFRKYDVLCTDENFDRFIHSKMSSVLKDRSVEEGWEIMDIIVSDSLAEFDLFDEGKIDYFLGQGEWIVAPNREDEEESACWLWENFKEAEAYYEENKNELFVYTVVDCEGLWISEGYHYVNRFAYMFSKVKVEMEEGIPYRP